MNIQNKDFTFLSESKRKSDLIDYFKDLALKRKGTNSDNWQSTLKYLHRFSGGSIKISDLNRSFCDGFREHLLNGSSLRSHKPLARNLAISYYNKFRAALKQAYVDRLTESNLRDFTKSIRPEDTRREYLTFMELKKVANINFQVSD